MAELGGGVVARQLNKGLIVRRRERGARVQSVGQIEKVEQEREREERSSHSIQNSLTYGPHLERS